MGRIWTQQVRVFALFSVAFFLTGLAYAYSAMGDTLLAVAMGATALAFIGSMVLEAQSR